MNPVGLKKENALPDFRDWHNRITRKELKEVKSISLGDFQ